MCARSRGSPHAYAQTGAGVRHRPPPAQTAGLNKIQVGDYLGEREDFSLKVMHAYVDALDFDGLEFDESIRQAHLRCAGADAC